MREKVYGWCLKLNTSMIPILFAISGTVICKNYVPDDWIDIYVSLLIFSDALWRLACTSLKMICLNQTGVIELLASGFALHKSVLELILAFCTFVLEINHDVLLFLTVVITLCLVWADSIYMETKVKPGIKIKNFLSYGNFYEVNNNMIFVENKDATEVFKEKADYVKFALLICQVAEENEGNINFYIDRYYRKKEDSKIKRFLHIYGVEDATTTNIRVMEREILKSEIHEVLDKVLVKQEK